HLVADEDPAGLERLIPVQTEVLAIDGRAPGQARALPAPGIPGAAAVLDLEHDRAGDAMGGQLTLHLEALLAQRLDLRALERDVRILFDVQEVGRLEVPFALGLLGLDAGGVDLDLNPRGRRILLIELERRAPLFETAMHL